MLDPIAIDLGRRSYEDAFAEQTRRLDEVAGIRERGGAHPGFILAVEHEPVITLTRKARASGSLISTPELLARHGVSLRETDRGGDITYHGPGQLVVYPIIDLNARRLGLHAYLRMLEQSVIDALAMHGIAGLRDPSATGVWVNPVVAEANGTEEGARVAPGARKIAAMGVRVRKWITLHGLSLNIAPNLDHFGLIVPCGLVGRGVTSMSLELGTQPTFDRVRREVLDALRHGLRLHAEATSAAHQERGARATGRAACWGSKVDP